LTCVNPDLLDAFELVRYRPPGHNLTRRSFLGHWRTPMVDKPLTDPLIVCASEGKVLVEGPGVATTLGVEYAANLSDDLLAASSSARLQQHRAIGQGSKVRPTAAE
jgi:hypothetical protein